MIKEGHLYHVLMHTQFNFFDENGNQFDFDWLVMRPGDIFLIIRLDSAHATVLLNDKLGRIAKYDIIHDITHGYIECITQSP